MTRIPRLVALAGALSVIGIGALGSPAKADGNLPLSNGPTTDKLNCDGAPADVDSWHFVLTPGGGGLAFAKIYLNLGNATVEGTIVPNGGQLDNVYVPVPAGYTLTSLVKAGTSADYTGTATQNSNFNLSHICDRTPPPPPPDDDPTDPTDPTVPPTDPTVPPTDPTVPPTDPTVPPTEPTVPPTQPTVPATQPTPTPPAPSTEAPTSAPTEAVLPPTPPTTEAAAAPIPTAPGSLPATGSSDEILILAAALSLGAGIALIALTRRARKA